MMAGSVSCVGIDALLYGWSFLWREVYRNTRHYRLQMFPLQVARCFCAMVYACARFMSMKHATPWGCLQSCTNKFWRRHRSARTVEHRHLLVYKISFG